MIIFNKIFNFCVIDGTLDNYFYSIFVSPTGSLKGDIQVVIIEGQNHRYLTLSIYRRVLL